MWWTIPVMLNKADGSPLIASTSKLVCSTKRETGVTLIEIIVFLVVIGLALSALLRVFNQSVVKSVDPVVRVRALDIAQAQLDEILSRKFDENTPTGGFPPCGSATGPTCMGIAPDAGYDDVGDYNGYSDTSTHPLYPITVSVSSATFGPASVPARLIMVKVGMPGGDALTLSAYRTNF